MQISFGAKIPIYTCNVYDNQAKSYVKTIFYEIDCKDKSDIDIIVNLPKPWIYRRHFLNGILQKNNQIEQKEENAPFKIYSMEDFNRNIAGLCKIESDKDTVNVDYIETSPSKRFRFSGQAMLASIAKQIYEEKKDLTIKNPALEARYFYENICEFDKTPTGTGFILPYEKMNSFIERTEVRTSGKISNY